MSTSIGTARSERRRVARRGQQPLHHVGEPLHLGQRDLGLVLDGLGSSASVMISSSRMDSAVSGVRSSCEASAASRRSEPSIVEIRSAELSMTSATRSSSADAVAAVPGPRVAGAEALGGGRQVLQRLGEAAGLQVGQAGRGDQHGQRHAAYQVHRLADLGVGRGPRGPHGDVHADVAQHVVQLVGDAERRRPRRQPVDLHRALPVHLDPGVVVRGDHLLHVGDVAAQRPGVGAVQSSLADLHRHRRGEHAGLGGQHRLGAGVHRAHLEHRQRHAEQDDDHHHHEERGGDQATAHGRRARP